VRKVLTVTSMLLVSALACNMPSPNASGGSVTASPQLPSVPTALQTLASSTTSSPIQGTASSSGTMPAPVYLIADDHQIWRIESDATTAKQITFEPAPVVSFDISPIDSSIAYVTNNSLYNVDLIGANRALLVQGPTPPDPNSNERINTEMRSVHFSPDGTKIAFGLGGVQIYDINAGQSTMIHASDPYPDINNMPTTTTPVRFYSPGSFSPDGTYLMILYGNFPEGGGTQIMKLADATVTDVTVPENTMVCCDEGWSPNSQSIYFASPTVGYTAMGLWRADAPNWQATTLIPGETEGGFRMPSNARALNDGNLYYFFSEAHELPNGNQLLAMTRSALDGVTDRAAVRTDTYATTEVLWDPDAKGAVVRYNPDPNNYSPIGPVVWLPADGSPALSLPKEGLALHWGK